MKRRLAVALVALAVLVFVVPRLFPEGSDDPPPTEPNSGQATEPVLPEPPPSYAGPTDLDLPSDRTRTPTLIVNAVDEAERPVKGVRVRLLRERRLEGGWGFQREEVTDAEGRAVFTGVPPGPAILTLTHDLLGSPDWPEPEVPDEGSVEITVVMPTGRTIRGRVLDAESENPVAGARVGSGYRLHRAVETDADGRFVYPGATEYDTEFHVLANGYARQEQKIPAEGELEFRLTRGDSVVGRVLGTDGEPVAGAELRVFIFAPTSDGLARDSRDGRTGDDGRFHIGDLRRDGTQTLQVNAVGHGRTYVKFDPAPDGPGTVDLGNIVLPVGRTIAGVATDVAGNPMVGAIVELQGYHVFRGSTVSVAERRETDEQGRFRFDGLSPASYTASLEARGAFDVVRTVELTPTKDILDLHLKLHGDRTLTVKVEDRAGWPRRGVDVNIDQGKRRADAKTGRDGIARFVGLQAAGVHVSIASEGDEYRSQLLGPVVPEGQEILIVAKKAARITGTVVDPDGNPIAGANLTVVEPDGERVDMRCEDDGSFNILMDIGEPIDLLMRGLRTASRGPGGERLAETLYRGELRRVTAPALDLILRTRHLETDRTLTVRLLDVDGDPVVGRKIAVGDGFRYPVEVTDKDGRARFADLPGEEQVVRLEFDSDEVSTVVNPAALRLVPDGQEVELRYRVGVWLHGLVVDSDGSPVHGANVSLLAQGEEGGLWQIALTDAEGKFSIPALPGAKHVLWANKVTKGVHLRGDLRDIVPDGRPLRVMLLAR